jgi:ribosomal protein L11 methyltransferase
MLRGKYKRYETLYIYSFRNSHPALKEFDDEDLIGVWEEEGISVLFFHKPKDELVKELMEKYGLELDVKDVMPYESWNEKRIPKPFEIGPYKIAPLWYEGIWDIVFDPSIVFGEGAHPTTSMMLELSWEFYQNFRKPQKVLDIGCGTGILGLFWAKLGSEVIAVDINPLCVKVTKNNLALNGLSAEVIEGDIKKLLPIKVDLVLANLYKGLLEELFKIPSFWTSKFYMFSGFIKSMEEELFTLLKKQKTEVLLRKEKEGWISWLVENKEIKEEV